MIPYEVRENYLIKGTYYPRVIPGRQVPFQQIVDEVVAEKIVDEALIRATIDGIARRVTHYLLENRVPCLDGFMTLSISLGGVMDSPTTSLGKNAEVRVNATIDGNMMDDIRRRLVTQKVHIPGKRPVLKLTSDVRSSSQNAYVGGGIIHIEGNDLKFNPENTDEGVFFVSIADNSSVRSDTYSHVGNVEVNCLVPSNLVGDQFVEIHTRYKEGDDVHIGRLKAIVEPITS
jgi:hypothetical protein